MTENELKNLLAAVTPPDETARAAAHAHWAVLAKPLGGLGRLEAMVEAAAALTGDPVPDVSRRAVLVLCGGETRAKNLHRLLEEKGIPATLDLSGAAMPAAGEVRLSLGALSAGSEWPALKLAVLTEGQLTAPAMRKRQRVKKDSNRQKLQSYTDLSPGDLVVHEHHGVGRFVGIQRMPVDGVEKDYIKIDYAGGDCLYVPVTQLDLVSK
mgnify:FL=1